MRRKAIKKRRPRDKRTTEERQTAEQRRALIQAAKIRRGVKIDFTERKLGTRITDIGRPTKIVRCDECGKKGLLSTALAPSRLIIHRGVIKDDKFQLLKVYNGENPPHCVNSPIY